MSRHLQWVAIAAAWATGSVISPVPFLEVLGLGVAGCCAVMAGWCWQVDEGGPVLWFEMRPYIVFAWWVCAVVLMVASWLFTWWPAEVMASVWGLAFWVYVAVGYVRLVR
jgi:hypothetical protein